MQFVARGNEDLNQILAEPKVRALMDDASKSFRLLDLEGNFVVVSAGAKHITGYEPNEYIQLHSQDLTHPDDRRILAEAMAAVATGPVEIVGRGLHKSGEVLWVRARGMMLHNHIAACLEVMDEPVEHAYWQRIDPFL